MDRKPAADAASTGSIEDSSLCQSMIEFEDGATDSIVEVEEADSMQAETAPSDGSSSMNADVYRVETGTEDVLTAQNNGAESYDDILDVLHNLDKHTKKQRIHDFNNAITNEVVPILPNSVATIAPINTGAEQVASQTNVPMRTVTSPSRLPNDENVAIAPTLIPVRTVTAGAFPIRGPSYRNSDNRDHSASGYDISMSGDPPGDHSEATHLAEAFLVQTNPNDENAVVAVAPLHTLTDATSETLIVFTAVATETTVPPYRVPVSIFVIITVILIAIVIGVSVYFTSPQDNNLTAPTPSAVPVDTQCFRSVIDLREAAMKYLEGDDSVRSMYGEQIGSWCVGLLSDFSYLFYPYADSETEVFINFNEDISQWNTSSAVTMRSMFESASFFNQDISKWDVSKVRDMKYMFYRAAVFNQNLSLWNVSSVNNMRGVFEDAFSFNGDISSWDVSSVTSMESMFGMANSFNQDVSRWDVSKVTTMIYMFKSAYVFNQDLSSWDVSSVRDMFYMFWEAKEFNHDLSAWDVSSVTDMECLFCAAYSFNGNVSTWNVSSAQVMTWMFWQAKVFNQDLSSWDVSKVTYMNAMFQNATSFNQNLAAWNVSAVVDMEYMFSGAESFNQDITSWDVSSVTNMENVFESATAFNQDLSSWDISKVTTMVSMFASASNFSQNLCAWGLSFSANLTNTESMFEAAMKCPVTNNPDLTRDPPGPFCYVCS